MCSIAADTLVPVAASHTCAVPELVVSKRLPSGLKQTPRTRSAVIDQVVMPAIKPFIVGHRVLDVGCATGYGAVLLSRLAGRVVAVEEEPALASAARRFLAELAPDVSLIVGPLTAGAPGERPFDAILVEGSIETVPEALARQLKEGGRLAAVIGSGGMGRATLHVRTGRVLSQRPVFDAASPPLPGFAVPRQFVF